MSAVAKFLLVFWLAFGFGQPVFAASTQVQSQVCQAGFATPAMSVNPGGTTTQSSAVVSGTAQAFSNLKVYNNGSVVASLPAAGDGTYSATIPLTIGDNQIHVNSADGCAGHDLDTATETVTRLAVVPSAPTVSQPTDGLQTTESSVLVGGTTEPDVEQITVFNNGQIVATATPDGAGNFAVTAGLVIGQNRLQVTATRYGLTSPASDAVTVGRSNPPPPQTPTPLASPVSSSTPRRTSSPPPAAAPKAPVIMSPSDGTVTNQDSLTFRVGVTPGSVVRFEDNGRFVAQTTAPASGVVEVSVPLELGSNRLVVTSALNSQSASSVVTVTRQAATPVAPMIDSPPDNTVLKKAGFILRGRAPAGSEVVIDINNTREVARVKIGADGRFEVKLELARGDNLVAARTRQNNLLSSPALLRLTYAPPQSFVTSLQQIIGTGLEGLMVGLVAALLILWEIIIGLLRFLDGHPLAELAVLIIGIGCAGLSTGLVGLESYLTVWTAVRYLFQQSLGQRRPKGLASGVVRDSLTGQPLPLAVVTSAVGISVTDLSGEFYLDGATRPYVVRRPGYRQLPERVGLQTVWMEPVRLNATLPAQVLDLVLGVAGWSGLVLGVVMSFYSLALHPEPQWLLSGVVTAVLVVFNAVLLAIRPPMKWGRLVDQAGRAVTNATVELYDRGSGKFIDRYRVDQQGNYTLFAQPGQYVMKVEAPGHQFAEQPVSVSRRTSYFGWLLKGR